MGGRGDWAAMTSASSSLVKWTSHSSASCCSTQVMQAWRTSRPRWDSTRMQQQQQGRKRQQLSRGFHDYLRVNTAGGSSARIPLKDGRSGGVFGSATTRGSRPTQEDTFRVSCVHVDPVELRHSLQSSRSKVLQEAGRRWDPVYAGEDDAIAGQVVWFGCFDGHGGQAISSFLRDELHGAFEGVDASMTTDTVRYTRNLGGYFRRFQGGLLSRWVRQDLLPPVRASRPGAAHHRPKKQASAPPSSSSSSSLSSETASDSEPKIPNTEDESTESPSSESSTSSSTEASATPGIAADEAQAKGLGSSSNDVAGEGQIAVEKIDPPTEVAKDSLSLAERATLAWLHVDRRIQSSEALNVGGSTASVALLHSLDLPAQPWYSSKLLSITSIHIGDTRMLLCPTSDGHAIPLTNYHHPDDRAEAERLRRVGAGLITDSFGEARWMGALANTRAFGDSHFKKAGVTAEPEVISQVLKGDDFAFVVCFSDGIGGVVSDQEVVDLCRGAPHPHDAAKNVLRFAEELGSDDNATVLVIPLRGWGNVGGEDRTKENREYKKSKVDLFRDHRQ